MERDKWIKDQNGKYVEAFEYIIVKGEIIFTAIDHNLEKNDADFISQCINYPLDNEDNFIGIFDYVDAVNLNIPVPFKAGDIIECDGIPFGPPTHILILETGDNIDCCCLQGMSLDPEGKWVYGAVKHGHAQYHDYFPMISPLYSARIFDGEPDEGEELLFEIGKIIGGDEEKGRALWYELKDRRLDNDQLKSAVEKVFGKEL